MTTPSFDRLAKVELREAWKREDTDFTPWLAAPENLPLLGEAIGIELELQGLEQNIGSFRADILCKDTSDGSVVLIENQIERTDHSHLGQILTYAAGTSAASMVWIAARFTEEHRAALDWLNEISHDNCRFFGLEIELWRIGDSSVAPKFNVIAKPNNWTRSIKKRTASGATTEIEALRPRFWAGFLKSLEENNSRLIYNRTPSGDPWMTWGLGNSKFQNQASVGFRDGYLDVSTVIYDHEMYRAAETQQAKLDEAADEPLEWVFDEQRKQNYVRVRLDGVNPTDDAAWPEQWAWLRQKLEMMDRIFRPAIPGIVSLVGSGDKGH